MIVLGSGAQPGPDIVSFLSYYANAAVWAWNTASSFSADKLLWGIPVALASAWIGASITRRRLVGMVVGPLFVFLVLLEADRK
jgi:hypothetical protein